MEVMNDIIGTLEADHISTPSGATGGSSSNKENESRNSRSLVVDIHLPPASEDDEAEPEACSNVPVNTRPCKHEVNRFQRCYSDGSQASPKRKAKVTFYCPSSLAGPISFLVHRGQDSILGSSQRIELLIECMRG